MRWARVFMLAAVAGVMGCNDGGDSDGGGNESSSGGGGCEIVANSEMTYCYELGDGYTDSTANTFCSNVHGDRVSSCPSENVVGTCTVSSTSQGTEYRYDWLFYGSNSVTCEAAQQMCAGVNSYTDDGMSSTFEGDGCGSNAGAFAGLDEDDVASAPDGSAACIISAGDVTATVPCDVLGGDIFAITSTDAAGAFTFLINGAPTETGTYSSDGSRPATAEVSDINNHDWQMFDNYLGMPEMGSYTLELTEVTETISGSLSSWTEHGSLELQLDASTLSGATGSVLVNVDF